MQLHQEKRQQRGCGCCLLFVLGFAGWMFVVIGPFFPRQARAPFTLSIKGVQESILSLATGETRSLSIGLQGRLGLVIHPKLQLHLRSSEPHRLVVLSDQTIRAIRPGEVTLTLRAKLAPGQPRLPRSKRTQWQAQIRIWISPWQWKRGFVLPPLPRHTARHLPLLRWFRTPQGLQLLSSRCRAPQLSPCQPRWRRWQRTSRGWTPQLFLLPRTQQVLSSPETIGPQWQDRILFLGGSQSHPYQPQTQWLQPIRQTWSLGPKLPSTQYLPTSVIFGSKLYLFGGSNTFTDKGGQKLQSYNLNQRRWERQRSIPDRSWEHDRAISLNDHIYLLNQRGALRRYTPASNRWAKMADLPSPQPQQRNRHPQLARCGGFLLAMWSHHQQAERRTWIYDPLRNQWHSGPFLPFGFLPGSHLITDQGQLWLAGGSLNSPTQIRLLSWRPNFPTPKRHQPSRSRPNSAPNKPKHSPPATSPTSHPTTVPTSTPSPHHLPPSQP